jgi:DNA-binding transcriptional LysR family regulator
VSQLIRQLERRLRVTLLSRTTRSTSLTEIGRRFLEKAGPAIDEILGALDGIESSADKPSGLLRLNLPRAIYYSYLAPRLTSFSKKYPDITVELCFEEGQSDVVREGFDAGIRLSGILAKDMVAIKLYGPVKFVVSGSPKYFNKMGRPKHPKDLLSYNCILARLGNFLYDHWEFEDKGTDLSVQVKGSLIVNDSYVLLNSALAGAGVIYTSENLVKAQVESGKLEVVLKQYVATSSGFYLYYPKRSQVLPKLRVFIQHLKESDAP